MIKKLIGLLILALFSFVRLSSQIEFEELESNVFLTIKAIAFGDVTTGYACGDEGTLIKTSDGGETWTNLDLGISENLWDIKVIPGTASQGVLVCGDNNIIAKSLDGGQSWQFQLVPFAPGSFVFGLFCLDDQQFFACGGDLGTFTGAILRSSDGGENWIPETVEGSLFLDKLYMLDSTLGFAAGTNTSFFDGSIHKTVEGNQFEQVNTSLDIVTNVWCLSPTKTIAIDYSGHIWKTEDAGANWSSAMLADTELYGLCFADSLHGFICGGYPGANKIFETSDGGNTWSNIEYDFAGIFQSICIIDNMLYVAGDWGRIIRAELSAPAAIDKIEEEDMLYSVFPIPATDKITIGLNSKLLNSSVQFQLFNSNGSKVFETSISAINNEIWLSELTGGCYFYVLMNKDGSVQRGKFIKQ